MNVGARIVGQTRGSAPTPLIRIMGGYIHLWADMQIRPYGMDHPFGVGLRLARAPALRWCIVRFSGLSAISLSAVLLMR